ncbi:MAG: hypothetical protein JWO86_32 [Myxococcaceae bacterium]|jgi:hypothetical protein|nr:hypothetical protein [Myxococcaceae bacterium]
MGREKFALWVDDSEAPLFLDDAGQHLHDRRPLCCLDVSVLLPRCSRSRCSRVRGDAR